MSNFLKIPQYEYTKGKTASDTSTYTPKSDLVFQSEKLNTVIRVTKEYMGKGVPTNLAVYLQEYLYKTAGEYGTFNRRECDSLFLEAALVGKLSFKNGIPTRVRNNIVAKAHAYSAYLVLRCCGFREWQH